MNGIQFRNILNSTQFFPMSDNNHEVHWKLSIKSDLTKHEKPHLFWKKKLLLLLGAPKKWAFIKGTMNVIDMMTILPYFISIFLVESNADAGSFDNVRQIVQVRKDQLHHTSKQVWERDREPPGPLHFKPFIENLGKLVKLAKID